MCPNDAGIPPDLVANDGIYTADFQDVGVYLIKSKIHNRNGKACTTTLAERDYFELRKFVRFRRDVRLNPLRNFQIFPVKNRLRFHPILLKNKFRSGAVFRRRDRYPEDRRRAGRLQRAGEIGRAHV